MCDLPAVTPPLAGSYRIQDWTFTLVASSGWPFGLCGGLFFFSDQALQPGHIQSDLFQVLESQHLSLKTNTSQLDLPPCFRKSGTLRLFTGGPSKINQYLQYHLFQQALNLSLLQLLILFSTLPPGPQRECHLLQLSWPNSREPDPALTPAALVSSFSPTARRTLRSIPLSSFLSLQLLPA